MPKEETFPFENTEVYKKSYEFTKFCREILSVLPKKYYNESDQLKRASLSICNNFAEGYGRWHVKDKQQFYAIARGSAYECVPVISLLHEQNQINEEDSIKLRSQIAEITRMLSAMIQGLSKRQ